MGVHPPKPMMHMPPISNNIYNPPTFAKMFNLSLFSFNLLLFSLNLHFFISPYFDHDAFTHYALHVLDIPDPKPQAWHFSKLTNINLRSKQLMETQTAKTNYLYSGNCL